MSFNKTMFFQISFQKISKFFLCIPMKKFTQSLYPFKTSLKTYIFLYIHSKILHTLYIKNPSKKSSPHIVKKQSFITHIK